MAYGGVNDILPELHELGQVHYECILHSTQGVLVIFFQKSAGEEGRRMHDGQDIRCKSKGIVCEWNDGR